MKLRRLILPITVTILSLLIVNIVNVIYDRTINTSLALDQMNNASQWYIDSQSYKDMLFGGLYLLIAVVGVVWTVYVARNLMEEKV